jgi:hypothetical protein
LPSGAGGPDAPFIDFDQPLPAQGIDRGADRLINAAPEISEFVRVHLAWRRRRRHVVRHILHVDEEIGSDQHDAGRYAIEHQERRPRHIGQGIVEQPAHDFTPQTHSGVCALESASARLGRPNLT